MNQILSVEAPKKSNKKNRGTNGPIEIKKIVMFFSIALIVFGVFLVGTGVYSMFQNTDKTTDKGGPTIFISEDSATEVTLQVSHKTNLSKVTYRWNDEDEISVDCTGKKSVEQKIEIPNGENELHIYAQDISGQDSTYDKKYTVEGNVDITFQVSGRNIVINAQSETELSYMTYKWDDEEETKVDIDSTQVNQSVEIPKGLHKLVVVVVDINEKSQRKEQEVNGITKPKIEVTQGEDGKFKISTSDESGVKKVVFTINDEGKKVLNLDKVYDLEDRKTFEYSYPLKDGTNKIKVIVYNEDDESETAEVELTK